MNQVSINIEAEAYQEKWADRVRVRDREAHLEKLREPMAWQESYHSDQQIAGGSEKQAIEL